MYHSIFFQKKRSHLFALHPLALALLAVLPITAQAQEKETSPSATFGTIVVTAPRHAGPLLLHTDPKVSRQPLPAQDGADFLSHLPGFSQIRKGGASGDTIFRGMSGSRVGILLDGQEIYGGCGMRMDPPTAYVYPESFDTVTIIKGPQSVLNGAGQSAGSVNFAHRYLRPETFSISGGASATSAQTARNDQTANITLATPNYYFKAAQVHARANNYKDGDGNTVHSQYKRWNSYAALGWTPDADTRLELSGNIGDGEAAAADSPMMDGSQYRREHLALLLEKQQLAAWLPQLKARVYRNYVDHVMDNYSLRPAMPGNYRANNPDRWIKGAYLAATIAPPQQDWELTFGADWKSDQHRSRMSGTQANAAAANAAYRNKPRNRNLRFEQRGIFAELRAPLTEHQQLISGARIDRHEVIDQRQTSAYQGEKDQRTLSSGFVRLEQQFEQGYTYIGIGHAQRFADFWERLRADANGNADAAATNVNPEKLTQLDIGGQYETDTYTLNLSAFYGHIHDYVLLHWQQPVNLTQTLNIDARTWGFELEADYRFTTSWKAAVGISHVWGSNRTHHQPLAQQPPLEARLGIDYAAADWSVGVLWRGALQQRRYHQHYGGIASKDNGPTPGFGVLAVHAGWKMTPELLLTAGIDNVLNQTYAQHLSKNGGGAGIWPGEVRIPEPGRTAWLKAQWNF